MLRAWRLPLRMGWREAARARGRSILVLVMIALPVLAVTAAAVVMKTQDVSSVQGLDRRLGAAAAEVTLPSTGSNAPVVQAPDPDQFMTWMGGELDETLTAAKVSEVLGGARLVPRRSGTLGVTTALGVADVQATEIDLGDPLAVGLFDLISGRLPQAPDEVVINAVLAAKGYAVGDALDLNNDASVDPTIVGLVESTTLRDQAVAAGPLGSLGPEVRDSGQTVRSWLVDGAAVSWAQVRELNQQGAVVLSRAVVTDPPPLPPQAQQLQDLNSASVITVIVLVVVMALLEVVLLAGPAFAVGARRQSRSLALMAAAGGTPAQLRRVVLAGAVVLGGLGAAGGAVLGIGAGWLLVPLVQRYSGTWFGPFEVPWSYLAGIAGFGLLSALLAAVVPAWISSRQDVVAVLGGRRGDRRASVRSPLVGLVLLGVGIAGAVHGSRASADGEVFIAGSAIFAVLGMVLLVPVVLVVLSAVSRWLPLTLRYAVRDAARHRSRTVPAVAAVAATVAGVVALGIAVSSDEAQYRATYLPSMPAGVGALTVPLGAQADLPVLRAMVERELPDATITPVRGVGDDSSYTALTAAGGQGLLDSYGTALGSDLLVSDRALPPGLLGVPEDRVAAAERMLARGGVVAFTSRPIVADEVHFRTEHWGVDGTRDRPVRKGKIPAVLVQLDGAQGSPQAVLSPAAARELGWTPGVVSLVVTGAEISKQQESDLTEALAGVSGGANFTVERGYQADDQTVIIQLILGGLGAVLMLGGTLTATFLALSDARPDLATLSAVGAAPRTRRGVAAAYALVVGVTGAVLGAGVGFIPGVAVTYPLTANSYRPDELVAIPTHYLDVPWLLIGTLVVALPLFTAVVVGVTARSRLPLVARLD